MFFYFLISFYIFYLFFKLFFNYLVVEYKENIIAVMIQLNILKMLMTNYEANGGDCYNGHKCEKYSLHIGVLWG